jgi:tRNA threonylcarbamoyl adenosine modification protein (Sua5/YciO/YrdC/YwlC family)
VRSRVDPAHPDPGILAEAARHLRGGDLVVIPTDTVYGVAADPRVPGAIDKVFAAKQRPPEKDIPYLIAGIERMEAAGAEAGPVVRRLADRFWPGPLTLVVPVPGGRIGFRVPNHPVALALLNEVDTALAVSSANRSGEPPACSAEEAERALGEAVALVLDAGPTPGGAASSVVGIEGDTVRLLRQGALPWPDIKSAAEAAS